MRCRCRYIGSLAFQEVVGNLVTHIGSGSPGEVEGSLDILARLIETDVQKMAPFAVFVKVCFSTKHPPLIAR